MKDTSQGRHTKAAATKSRNVHTFSSDAYLAKLMGELDRAAICQRIGLAREQAGLTQPEMGEALDPPIHWRTVQTWESVKKPVVPWGRLDEIATVTGVTKEWLLHGTVASAEGQPEMAELLSGLVAAREEMQELREALEARLPLREAESP